MEPSPFLPGGTLKLRDKDGCDRTFTIVKGFETFTRGQAIAVRSGTHPQHSLLVKIFDPRYFHERFDRRYSNYVERHWTLEAEASAVVDPEPLPHGTGYLVPQELEKDEPPADEPEAVAHRAARWEKHLQARIRSVFDNELAAYERLQALWGTAVPNLIIYGKYLPSEPRHIQPPALVLEYIDGITLSRVAAARITPPLVAQLAHIVRQLHAYGVLHNDLHLDNAMVDLSVSPPRPVVIDFGQAILRAADETAETWNSRMQRIREWPDGVTALLAQKHIPWQAEFDVPFYTLYHQPPA
ncbi:hypothetical protein PENSPDRAFT_655054 [Peniophora sp. CONT]|nr:hypothetical protein PENSPDRAFT_655054 [Peniophora sp. CONT]